MNESDHFSRKDFEPLDRSQEHLIQLYRLLLEYHDYYRKNSFELHEVIAFAQRVMLLSDRTPITFTERYLTPVGRLAGNARYFLIVLGILFNNSAEAIGAGPGSIRIEVATARGAVLIRIENTGVGIKKEDRDRLFEPGFTTKNYRRGTGLPIAKKILKEMFHGTLNLADSLMNSTCFELKIPYRNA